MSRRYSFTRWLLTQDGRSDSVGAFARYVMADDEAPIGAFREGTWQQYLARTNAPQPVRDGVAPAFANWAHYNGAPTPDDTQDANAVRKPPC